MILDEMVDIDNANKIKFLFLGLAGHYNKNNYDLVSKDIRDWIKSKVPEDFESEGLEGDPQSWYYRWGKKSLSVDNEEILCDIIIKHFKVRVILEVKIATKESELVNLFKEARKLRTNLSDNEYIKHFLLSFVKNEEVEGLYWYPIIQIPIEYTLKEYDTLKDESITSFFYEVQDSRRETSILFPKVTLIRVSRPSIIMTKASKFMQDEIINAIYDTCLDSLRKEKNPTPSIEIARDMRNYIERILFNHEEMVANAEINRAINYIQIITIFGVLATTLALITIIGLDIDLPEVKSMIGLILFIATLFVLATVILYRSSSRFR
jgi:hypothetical protein